MKREMTFTLILLLLVSSVQAISIFLSDTLDEGEGRIYETNLGSYIVKLVTVSDATEKVLFELNGEKSKAFGLKDSFKFNDDSEIVLMDLTINDADTGRDEATFFFYGSGKSPILAKNLSYGVIEDKKCNFDNACSGETQAWCCYDCGCDEGRCKNNRCIIDEDQQQISVDKGKAEEPTAQLKKEKREGPSITITPERKVRAISVVILLLGVGILIPFIYLIKKRKQRF